MWIDVRSAKQRDQRIGFNKNLHFGFALQREREREREREKKKKKKKKMKKKTINQREIQESNRKIERRHTTNLTLIVI